MFYILPEDEHLVIETRVKVLNQWFGESNKHCVFITPKVPNKFGKKLKKNKVLGYKQIRIKELR